MRTKKGLFSGFLAPWENLLKNDRFRECPMIRLEAGILEYTGV